MAGGGAAWLVSGAVIEFKTDGSWQWFGGFDGQLTVQTDHYLQVANSGGRGIVLASDLVRLAQQLIAKPYVSGPFTAGGTVTLATVTVDDTTLSRTCLLDGERLATEATVGRFQVVCALAVNPVTGVPDPVPTKSGTWKVAQPGQALASSREAEP
jgi:hypothetical protein